MSAIEVGGHYLCAGTLGYDPVRIWVGRIERIDGAEGGATDVASVTVKGDGAGLRSVAHMAFEVGAVLGSHPEPTDAFVKNVAAYDEAYAEWRVAVGAGTAQTMTMSPSEAYGRAMDKISEGARHDHF